MLRAVLDANVLVSAFIRSKGPSGRILDLFEDRGAFELVLSTEILEGFRRVLRYPRIRKELAVKDDETEERIASLEKLAILAEGDVSVKAVVSDPDDDKYISAALLGRSEFIVSGDRHLLDLGAFQGVAIVTPRKFMEILAEDQPLLRVRPLRRRTVKA